MLRDRRTARRNRQRQMITDVVAAQEARMAEETPAPDPEDDGAVLGVDEDRDDDSNVDDEEEVGEEEDDMDEDSVAEDADT